MAGSRLAARADLLRDLTIEWGKQIRHGWIYAV